MHGKALDLHDGSSWRRWQRNGCKGHIALLLILLRDSAEAREIAGLPPSP